MARVTIAFRIKWEFSGRDKYSPIFLLKNFATFRSFYAFISSQHILFLFVLTVFIVERKCCTQHTSSELPRIDFKNQYPWVRSFCGNIPYLRTRFENNSTLNFSQLALCLEREVFSSRVKNGLILSTLFPYFLKFNFFHGKVMGLGWLARDGWLGDKTLFYQGFKDSKHIIGTKS